MNVLRKKFSATLIALALVSTPVLAHEFWIAPERGVVAPGDRITAELKVGQMLKGESYPYLSNRFQSFTDTVGGATTEIVGNEGDIPALATVAETPGLHVIAHHTIAFRVTYDDWAVFRRYLSDEGLDRLAERHRIRGLPETGFAERYTRCAKALVQVGPARPGDRDVPVGMPFELVAEANPYLSDVEALPVQLLWRGAPVANRQINVFHDEGAETRSSVLTDAEGRALIPLTGDGQYLLNTVNLEPVEDRPVVWSSHWASLSFKLQRGG